MGSLVSDPVYKNVRSGGPDVQPEGMEDVRNFYINEIFGSGRHVFESNKDRIVVDDYNIITEGTMRILQWGRDLVKMGAPVEDENATYLLTTRMLIVWPFDEDCRIIGEEAWSQTPTSPLEKISEEDIPESFKTYIASKL